MPNQPPLGASRRAISAHYDIDAAFYGLWLDESLTYSCALWEPFEEPLERAQERKIDFYLDAIGVKEGFSVLDVGCGWGGVLARSRARGASRIVGLTLSESQYERGQAQPEPVTCLLEGWESHRPSEPYDGIVSVGAFEHFARRDLTADERQDAYRRFFEFCAASLRRGGRVGLQTIVLEDARRDDDGPAARFIYDDIFPESSLPRVGEVVTASEPWFRVVQLVNHPDHYARTCRAWLDRLDARAQEATALIGAEEVRRYRRYLALSEASFRLRTSGLARVILERRNRPLDGA